MAQPESDPPSVRVDVLGPLRLLVDGRPVDVRGPKRRAVLAVLGVAEGRAVPVDHLLDALWPAGLPDSARGALHSHVFRLRGHLGPAGDRLETLDGAYRLVLGPDELDAARARALLTAARRRGADDPGGAAALLREARALWRGPVLAEFAEVAPLSAAAVGLEQLYREVTDALVAAAVEAGEVEGLVALATQALAADPLREPAVHMQMRALAASGRPAEALRVAREFRHRLGDEAGLDPSAVLGELERTIAAGGLAPAGVAPGAPPRTVRRVARPATPLVGREAQVAAVLRLLDGERLVTVVGPGGVGKTRLAIEVAARFDPAAVLRLAPLSDAAAVPHALAAALDLQVVRGDVLAACVALLGGGPWLLVIDNCEHLLDAVRDTVGVLLDACPELTVLATSREPLGLAGECPSRLAPLPVPAADDEQPARVPSVAVFLDRAARVRPGFAPDGDEWRLVTEVVRRLDGMPLAIELAAGRLSTLSLSELSERLDRALDLLGGARPSADTRHRTLRATVDWSYRLLGEDEQRLFRHLAVFPDGADLRTIERVAAGLDLTGDAAGALARLVDASMVEVQFAGTGTRYRMLETLRAFGVDRLAATGEAAAAAAGLVAWARELTAWISATVVGPDEPRADAVLRRELPNLRAAWRLALDGGLGRSRDLDDAIAIAGSLAEATSWRDLSEIRDWAEELAEHPELAGHPRAGVVLAAASWAAYFRGDDETAQRRARACLDRPDDEARWLGLRAMTLVQLLRGDFHEAVEHQITAAPLALRPNAGFGIAALAATYAGEPERARALNDRMAAEAASPTLRAFTAYVGGEIDSSAGAPAQAEAQYARALELARTSGATFVLAIASVGRLTVLVDAGRLHDALHGYRQVVGYFARTGNWPHLWTTLRNLARLLALLDDESTAALLAAAADAAPDAPPVPGPRRTAPGAATLNRVQVLRTAQDAIERHLARRRA